MAFTPFPPNDGIFETTNIVIPFQDIIWKDGAVFYKDISTDESFTFTDTMDGSTIMVILNNTDTLDHLITWPIGLVVDANYDGNIIAGTESVFTFAKSNGKIYVTEIREFI